MVDTLVYTDILELPAVRRPVHPPSLALADNIL